MEPSSHEFAGRADQEAAAPAVAAVHSAIAELVPLLIPGARFDAPTATVTIPADGRRAAVGTAALLGAAMRDARRDVPKLIEAWCSAVLDRRDGARPALRTDHLRTRLVPRRDVDPDRRIVKRYGSYFQLELMADLGHRRGWVSPDEATALGLEPDEALATGLRLTLTVEVGRLRVVTIQPAPGVEVAVASADDSPWAATGIVAVPDLFGLGDPRYGVIVGVPRSSAVLCRVVESARVIAELRLLGRLVADLHHRAPDPCSPDLFWLYGESMYPIVDADSDRAKLPVALEPVVRSLPTAPPAD